MAQVKVGVVYLFGREAECGGEARWSGGEGEGRGRASAAASGGGCSRPWCRRVEEGGGRTAAFFWGAMFKWLTGG